MVLFLLIANSICVGSALVGIEQQPNNNFMWLTLFVNTVAVIVGSAKLYSRMK